MWALFQAIKRSWAQHFVAQFSSLIILSCTFGAVLFIAMAMTNVQSLFSAWGKVNKVTVYLNPQADSVGVKDLKRFVESHELVFSANKVSSSQAAERFRKKFSKVNVGSQKLNKLEKYFPEYFEVHLNQELAYKGESQLVESFASQVKGFPVVQSVSYGKKWLSRYISVLHVIKGIGWLLIVLFLTASVIVSSNVTKTLLFSKKEEIEIMEFIGADDVTIFTPQVVNVLLLTLGSFLIALFGNWTLFNLGLDQAATYLSPSLMSQLSFIPLTLSIGLGGFAFCAIFSYSILTIYQMMPRRKKPVLISEESL